MLGPTSHYKDVNSRNSENRQRFIFSLVFLLKMGGGGGDYICVNISETRLGSPPEFFYFWNIYMPMDNTASVSTLQGMSHVECGNDDYSTLLIGFSGSEVRQVFKDAWLSVCTL